MNHRICTSGNAVMNAADEQPLLRQSELRSDWQFQATYEQEAATSQLSLLYSQRRQAFSHEALKSSHSGIKTQRRQTWRSRANNDDGSGEAVTRRGSVASKTCGDRWRSCLLPVPCCCCTHGERDG